MSKYVFALLEFRGWVLLAALAAGAWAVHVNGPFELQAPLDRVIFTPIAQSTAAAGNLLHVSSREAPSEK
jgi:hypothetical protein